MGHIAGKWVAWRRVALTPKRWKKRKVRGGEGKLLEKLWKKGGKREGQREKCEKSGKKEKNEKKVEREGGRKREKERLGRRPVTRYRKCRWDNACHVPVHFCTKSDHVRTASEKLRKMREKQENCKFEQSVHWFVTTNRPKMAPPQAQKARGAHHCPKKRAKMPHNTITTVLNSAKVPQITAKTTN